MKDSMNSTKAIPYLQDGTNTEEPSPCVTGAAGYLVYRGSTLLKKITKGSTLTFTDTKAKNGVKTIYKIVATASTGNSTLSKTVTFYPLTRPTIYSPTSKKAKKITVKWKKNAKASGYEIQYSLKPGFSGAKKAAAGKTSTSKVLTSQVKSGKTYYVRIRAFITVGGRKTYSVWSDVKKIKAK